jgi:cyclic beta-1,2-glucan synthetase
MATVHHSPLHSGRNLDSEVPILSAVADKPPLATRNLDTDDLEALRAVARQATQSWSILEPADSHERFTQSLAIVSKQIGRVTERLQDQVASGAPLKGDGQVLLNHLMVIRTALRECRQALRSKCELPCVKQGESKRPVPRVYALSLAYLDATDNEFDELDFPVFAKAIQEQSPLQMKELWNLRAYLEFSLLERIAELSEPMQQPSSSLTVVKSRSSGRLRRCAASLKTVLDLDWKKLFEQIDEIDRILKTDPLDAYCRMDFESRDAYRSAVAKLAASSTYSEVEVAREAIVLAREAQRDVQLTARAKERRTHVGFYLIGPGRESLKQRIGYRSSLMEKIRAFAVRYPDYFYFVSIEVAALAMMAGMLSLLNPRPPAVWPMLLLLLAVVECAVMVTNTLVTSLLPPKKLPRLDFSKGIPARFTTMVVVPTLLTSETQVRKAVKDLEIRFLGNRDANLHFGLLTDPPDSRQQYDDKDALAVLCSELIDELNRTYAGRANGTFFHFHRSRTLNRNEGVWMGWERKRGKLLQFNRYLMGQEDPFSRKTGKLSILPNVRYVITLDIDTQLPPGSAYRMVGAIAHPLNAAVIDRASNTVVEGYGILQPRVDISVRSAQRSRLASLFSGETGLDVYTRAVSDVYQDLFGEAIFSGKGIYDVATFQSVLDNRLPNNSVLSHDLIESAYARAGLLSDVEVVDDYPSSFSALNRRKHRWMRGDWQISPWLLSRVKDGAGRLVRNPVSHVSRWKILDNLRRAVTEMAIFAALVYAWLAVPGHAMRWTVVLLGVLVLPVYLRLLVGLINAGRDIFSRNTWKNFAQEWASSHARIFFRLAFLLHQTLIELDAAIRTLVRMTITRQRMLEWETAEHAESAARGTHLVDKYVGVSVMLAVALGAMIAIVHPSALLAAAPLLALWALLPKIASWLDRPSGTREPELSDSDRALIRNAALRTWRFFSEFSNAAENWLIPDLLQQTPPLVAHRISTTNLGLLLNARLAAYDLGYLTAGEFAEATEKTLEAVERMPKCNGQLYNWYSTHTLQPDEPLFISTVDNGNLLCSLWTLKEGCWEILKDPYIRGVEWQSVEDHVELLSQIIDSHPEADGLRSAIQDLRQRVLALSEEAPYSLEKYATLELDLAIFAEKLAGCSVDEEIRWWVGEFQARVKHLGGAVRDLAPWLRPEYAEICDYLGEANIPRSSELSLESCSGEYGDLEKALRRLVNSPSTVESLRLLAVRLLSDLRQAAAIAKKLHDQLSRVVRAAHSLADGMDFSIFFDEKREMLAIGYDAGEGCISKWHYDLLPSEARSAAFAGIAQGSIPHKMWFRLGRFHGTHDREPLLYSWSGTMFEYLMPCLWMKSHRNSLLERSARAAIRVQRKFAEQKGADIPWGVSECACNEYTSDGHYVYHAFGVPTLALHRDEYSNDVVIAPYASFLAMMIEPVSAARNVAKMKNQGWLGAYGFYDAIDFTPRRVSRDKQHEIVRTWMAHHQGMTLVAISNVLCDSAMQRRFHADSRVAAAERVLHEKAPRVLPAWEQELVEAFRPAATSADTAKSAA